jgi:DNA-binding LacI/PurR family transcriptional regulator
VDHILKQFSINKKSGFTIAHQIKRQIIWLLVSGTIKPADLLPSIRELARHLHINLHTVRNAYALLESDGLVETRQGLGTIVLEFDPIRIGKSVGQVSSHTVGVILPSLSNPVYHDVLRGIQEIADLDQTMIFVCNTLDQHALAWRYLNQLVSKQVDGLIVSSLDIESFNPYSSEKTLSEALKVPYVSIDTPKSTGYSVNIDLEKVGYQATRHLIEHGHKRIGLITYGYDPFNTRLEDRGYQRAIQEADLEIDPNLIAAVQGFTYADGEEGAEQLLSQDQPPSALFAISDTIAMGAIQAINSADLNVPDDIAVIGFNDIPTSSIIDPGLTTFSMPSYEMGKKAMDLLRIQIDGGTISQQQITLPTPLVTRGSCGCHVVV